MKLNKILNGLNLNTTTAKAGKVSQVELKSESEVETFLKDFDYEFAAEFVVDNKDKSEERKIIFFLKGQTLRGLVGYKEMTIGFKAEVTSKGSVSLVGKKKVTMSSIKRNIVALFYKEKAAEEFCKAYFEAEKDDFTEIVEPARKFFCLPTSASVVGKAEAEAKAKAEADETESI